MPSIAGNGLPVSAKKNLALRSGFFELVDAKFKRGLTDRKYTLREILSNDNCEVLLPTKEKFYRYVKSQIQSEKPKINIIQYLFFIFAGLFYLPSIIIGFYSASYVAADSQLTGESHHSILAHNFAVVWGDYLVPFIITCGVAGIFPLLVTRSKIKSDEQKIIDILDSVNAERDNTIKEHNLISCFFTLCEILFKFKKASSQAANMNERYEIINDFIFICNKYSIPVWSIIDFPYSNIYNINFELLQISIRKFLLSERYSEITKNIICKIKESIRRLQEHTITSSAIREVNPFFEDSLSNSVLTKNRILDIISELCAKKIDVREDPLPLPVFLTRDLDLLGVRDALFEYWGDLSPEDLVIHYTVDFNQLTRMILISYSKKHPEEFYQNDLRITQYPLLRQAPLLVNPTPTFSHCTLDLSPFENCIIDRSP